MPHDLTALARELPTLDLATRPTREQAAAAAADLGALGERELGLARFRGRPPWEKHSGDELLYVVDGSVELTLLREGDSENVELGPGSLFVVPAGTWHRSNARERVTVLFATPREGTESSSADDPRQ